VEHIGQSDESTQRVSEQHDWHSELGNPRHLILQVVEILVEAVDIGSSAPRASESSVVVADHGEIRHSHTNAHVLVAAGVFVDAVDYEDHRIGMLDVPVATELRKPVVC